MPKERKVILFFVLFMCLLLWNVRETSYFLFPHQPLNFLSFKNKKRSSMYIMLKSPMTENLLTVTKHLHWRLFPLINVISSFTESLTSFYNSFHCFITSLRVWSGAWPTNKSVWIGCYCTNVLDVNVWYYYQCCCYRKCINSFWPVRYVNSAVLWNNGQGLWMVNSKKCASGSVCY